MSDSKQSVPSRRLTLRLVVRDAYARIEQVLEQEMPESAHDVELFLRRAIFREAIAAAMLAGGTATIERRDTK